MHSKPVHNPSHLGSPDWCGHCGGPHSLASLGFSPGATFVPLTPADIEQPLGSRITQVANQQPDRLAVCSPTGSLTYGELIREADRMAWAIERRLGRGKEPVALCFDYEGLAGPIGYVACLKTGRPYVSLDVGFPYERLRYVLRQSGAVMVLTDAITAASVAELASETRVPTFNLESLDRSRDGEPFDDRATLDDPSYINYTSGSTGRPKGIVWTHRGRMRVSLHAIGNLQYTPDDRFSMLHSYGFSAVGPELWGALQSGACLLPFSVRRRGLAALGEWLRTSEITIFQWIPSALRAFSVALPPEVRFPSVRLLLLASEAATDCEVEILRERFSPKCALVNRYGCSEAGLVTFFPVGRDTPVTPGRLPAGYVIPGRDVYLVDPARRQLPVGEEGEIVVRSSAISSGYWREPELTAERFQDVEGTDERILYTGDLGRFRPDGCLEYLGRVDAQLKVWGHRVEVAEVEAALRRLAGVEDAVVQGRADAAGECSLIAYLVRVPGAALTVTQIRSRLAGQLPDAMVPSRYVFLTALPRTPTGKLDPGALPDPGNARPELDEPFTPPATPLEAELAAIWSQVLGVSPVGRNDPFTHLGGNSLRAGQVLARITSQHGVILRLADFLERQTIAQHAKCILEALLGTEDTSLDDLLTEIEEG